MSAPLGGIRVLDLSRLLPGPFCTLILNDLGAEVVKVEEPGGGDYLRWWPPLLDDSSAYFHILNRGKKSIALNLKDSQAREIFLDLVLKTDVVVESFRPGVMERMGLGFETLKARKPNIILCSISGYGQDGPYRDRAGHDLNYLALSGIQSMTGCAEGHPAIPGVQIADIGGGGQNAVIAILAALRRRDQTGEAVHCDVSMFDGLVQWLSIHAAQYFVSGESSGPGKGELSGGKPCYRLYPCADGWLSVAALEPKFWQRFCEAVGLPELLPLGHSHDSEGEAAARTIASKLRTKTKAEWMNEFGADACVEPMNDLAAVFTHPQVVARGLIDSQYEHGTMATLASAFVFNGERMGTFGPAPRLGEHTATLLAEVGRDENAYASLQQQGVVA